MPPRKVPANGALIRSLRDKKGWSQERLAKESGVSVNKIRSLEKGEGGTPPIIRAVADVIGSSYDDLTAGQFGFTPTEDPDLDTILDRLRGLFSAQDAHQQKIILARVLSAMGLLCLLVGLFPMNAFPYYIAALILTGTAAVLAYRNNLPLAFPVAALSLATIATIAWPNAIGFFPSGKPDDKYVFSYGNRIGSDRWLYVTADTPKAWAMKPQYYELHLDRYPSGGSFPTEKNRGEWSKVYDRVGVESPHLPPVLVKPGWYAIVIMTPKENWTMSLTYLSPYHDNHVTVPIHN